MRCLILITTLLMGCDAGGLVTVETKDASADVEQDALEPVTPPDADICNCNGGSGLCATDADCALLDNSCCAFKCEPAGEVGKKCVGTPKQ